MKRVLQTKFGMEGNCLTAALASLLGVELADVAEIPEDRWWQRMEEAAHAHHHHPIWHPMDIGIPRGFCLGSVKSPRLDGQTHSVVVLDGNIIWDPHPDQDAYTLPLVEGFIVFVPLLPDKA